MKLTSTQQQQLQTIADRYNLDLATVEAFLFALQQGNGRMAQFNIPALGGFGQWMQGNMVMLGDMFNNNLKNTVNNLANDLVKFLNENDLSAANQAAFSQTQSQTDTNGNTTIHTSSSMNHHWWPAEWGAPASVGSQNGNEYAVFPAQRRLALKINGSVSFYDTGKHHISGVSQSQSNGVLGSVTFTSQKGTVSIDDLPKVTL